MVRNHEHEAQTHYEAAVEALGKYCEDNTRLMPVILDEEYPFRVKFIPCPQLDMFNVDNVDENGEVNDLTVTVGLSTTVKSTLRFKMDSRQLKKLIKLAENVGTLYYQAFREEAGVVRDDEEIEELREQIRKINDAALETGTVQRDEKFEEIREQLRGVLDAAEEADNG